MSTQFNFLKDLIGGEGNESGKGERGGYRSRAVLLTSDIVHCSMLAEDAIKSAISNYYTKNPKARKSDLGGTSAPLPKVEVETITEPKSATA